MLYVSVYILLPTHYTNVTYRHKSLVKGKVCKENSGKKTGNGMHHANRHSDNPINYVRHSGVRLFVPVLLFT